MAFVTEDELETFKYRQLQKMAKEYMIKANIPRGDMIKKLVEIQNTKQEGMTTKNDIDTKTVNPPRTKLPDDDSCGSDDEVEFKEKSKVQNKKSLNSSTKRSENTPRLCNSIHRSLNIRKSSAIHHFSASKNTSSLSSPMTKTSAKRFSSVEMKVSDKFVEFFGKDSMSFKSEDKQIVLPKKLALAVEDSNNTALVVTESNKKLDENATKANFTPHSGRKVKNFLKANKNILSSISKKTSMKKKVNSKNISAIPRLLGSKKVVPNFAALHAKEFEKLDSLDMYLQKKEKRNGDLIKASFANKTPNVKQKSVKEIIRNFSSSKQSDQDDLHSTITMRRNRIANNVDSPKVTENIFNTPFLQENTNPRNNTTINSDKFKVTKSKSITKPSSTKLAPKIFNPSVISVNNIDLNFSKKNTEKIIFNPKSKLNDDKKRRSERDKIVGGALLNVTNNATKVKKHVSDSLNKTFDIAEKNENEKVIKPLKYKPYTGSIKPLNVQHHKMGKNKIITQSTITETKNRQRNIIKGVRMNKRTELLFQKRGLAN